MESTLLIDAEQAIARLRAEVDAGHPAGPLYTAGEFAEHDMLEEEEVLTPLGHCLICTYNSSSKVGECCC
jgi:hypothetical protein